jgi:hypothetical protein
MNQEIWDQKTVWQKYREALEGLVSKTDLIESNRARLLKYAIYKRYKALSFINELLAVNPGATFDYLAGSSVDYQNAITVINWLSDETPKLDQPQKPQIEAKQEVIKFFTKHHVLAYIFECYAKGLQPPNGNKKELEKIGSKRMGEGKKNTFYKIFNEISTKDLHSESVLIKNCGENWRDAVIELSQDPELVENYLINKQL